MLKSYDNFIKLAIDRPTAPDKFLAVKKEIAKQLRESLPTNADLRECYDKMVIKKIIKRSPILEASLFSRKIRTQSGVAIVAVLTKPYPCPGRCIYCPGEKDMPKSYLKNEPAVMRAISAKFNPYIQVQRRIRALELNGHKTDKIELIVMGGTFSYLPKGYQTRFIWECFRAANDYPKTFSKPKGYSRKKLFKEQKKNETAKRRIIGLTLETRPDFIDEKELKNFRDLGCTRVELGVQSLDDKILELNRRGHLVQKTREATRLLRNFGFKVAYHIMPGLLGSNFRKDLVMFKKLFSDPDFRPDMLKIYPTVVINDSPLYDIWRKKKYTPLSDRNFKKMILKVKTDIIPPYVRISRLVRDVPDSSVLAGPKISNLRQLIAKESKCRCIRCREVGSGYSSKEKMVLNRIDYGASDGHEIFLQFVSPDKKKLFALLRLRLPRKNLVNPTFPILENSAIVREVHTYGKLLGIDTRDKKSPQHMGLGKKLMQEAEKIAKKESGARKIVVISGIGARKYYRKFGYRLKDTYMVKWIK